MKAITDKIYTDVRTEVKMLLHASRDAMRTLGLDGGGRKWQITDGWYGEAFGIMRALKVLGYGTFEPHREECRQDWQDLLQWFEELKEEVLIEENYGGSNECDFCLARWGRDGAGRTRMDSC